MSEQVLELGKEYPPAGEEAVIEEIMKIMRSSMESKPHPPMLRDLHPKSHGYVEGEFIVEENIPDEMKVGVFKEAKTYPVWIRFSNASGNREANGQLSPDTNGDVRGMAIKLMGVEGEMAIDDSKKEQDFVLINSPIFFTRDVKDYMDFFLVVKGIQEGKIVFKPGEAPEVAEELQETFKGISYAFSILDQIAAKPIISLLDMTYWSAGAHQLGDRAMKVSVVPHSNEDSLNLENAEDKSNYLREAMTKHLATKDAYFDFKIQLQTDPEKMPIEDGIVEWDEKESPYLKVASIKIPVQNFNTEERQKLDEKQSFSPWHSLLDHKPLGGINRSRKIYVELAKIRNSSNESNT